MLMWFITQVKTGGLTLYVPHQTTGFSQAPLSSMLGKDLVLTRRVLVASDVNQQLVNKEGVPLHG